MKQSRKIRVCWAPEYLFWEALIWERTQKVGNVIAFPS